MSLPQTNLMNLMSLMDLTKLGYYSMSKTALLVFVSSPTNYTGHISETKWTNALIFLCPTADIWIFLVNEVL